MNQTRHLLSPRPLLPRRLSIVIPVFNEAAALPELRTRLTGFLETIECREVELLFVNDGSADASLEILGEWANADPRVKVLCLARNFGHQAAVTAGLDEASGDAVIVMDADLQDPPEVISRMIDKYREGYDVVYGRRSSRTGETRFKRFTAWAFYRCMRTLVHRDLPADVGDFRLISRECLDALKSMRETHRFLRGMLAWVGFPQVAVEFERAPRCAGRTNYSVRKMAAFAWTAAISFSPIPLRVSLIAGVGLALFGVGDGIYAIVRQFQNRTVPGWTSIMVMLCLIGGGVLLSIGILGEYVGRIFEEVKGRPLYVVSRRLHSEKGAQPVARPALMLSVDDSPSRGAAAAAATATGERRFGAAS
jgi:glycosyltransferase involved in cell wall biosynthesis